jgi:hypothetical protein
MEPITTALIGTGINAIGNLIGGLFAGEDQNKAYAAIEEAKNILYNGNNKTEKVCKTNAKRIE